MPRQANEIARLNHKGHEVFAIGNGDILAKPMLGLFCSIRCPGNLIVQCYDLARALRDANIPVVSGFHTPMEREALEFLLKGTQPVVICPARSIDKMRLPSAWQKGIGSGRLLIASPFHEGNRRTTADNSDRRNQFVADLATEMLVIYAAPGGKTETLCKKAIAERRSVWTIDSPENRPLIEMGAASATAATIVERRAKRAVNDIR